MVENKDYKEIKKLIHEDNQDLLKFINKNVPNYE